MREIKTEDLEAIAHAATRNEMDFDNPWLRFYAGVTRLFVDEIKVKKMAAEMIKDGDEKGWELLRILEVTESLPPIENVASLIPSVYPFNLFKMATYANLKMWRNWWEAYHQTLSACLEIPKVPEKRFKKKIVWKKENSFLYHYTKAGGKNKEKMIVVKWPTISSERVLEINFIPILLEQYDVYMFDSKTGVCGFEYVSMHDYIDFINETINFISGGEKIYAIGICQGGTLLGTYLALYSEAPVEKVLFIVAPFDFSQGGSIAEDVNKIPKNIAMAALKFWGNTNVDEVVKIFQKASGREPIPAEKAEEVLLNLLKENNFNVAWDNAMTTEWGNILQSGPGPGMICQFLAATYYDNDIWKGTFTHRGRTAQLSNITAEVHVAAAAKDHISPVRAVMAITEKAHNAQGKVYDTGHIGLLKKELLIRDSLAMLDAAET